MVVVRHLRQEKITCEFCGMRWTFLTDASNPVIPDEENARIKEHEGMCPGRRKMA